MGIDLGDVTQLIHVTPLKHLEYSLDAHGPGKMFLMKKWSPVEFVCAPHAIVQNLGVQYEKQDVFKKVEDIFSQDSVVFMLNNMYYGSQGKILEPLLPNGRLKSKRYTRHCTFLSILLKTFIFVIQFRYWCIPNRTFPMRKINTTTIMERTRIRIALAHRLASATGYLPKLRARF